MELNKQFSSYCDSTPILYCANYPYPTAHSTSTAPSYCPFYSNLNPTSPPVYYVPILLPFLPPFYSSFSQHNEILPYSGKFSLVQMFAGPNFRVNPISPPEEIFAVLICVKRGLLTTPLYHRWANGTKDLQIAIQCHRQIERDCSAQNARAKVSTSSNVHAKVHVFKFSRFLFSRFRPN